MSPLPLFIGTVMRVARTSGAHLQVGQGVKRAIGTAQKKQIFAGMEKSLDVWNKSEGTKNLRFTEKAMNYVKSLGNAFGAENVDAIIGRANSMLKQHRDIALADIQDGEMVIQASFRKLFKGSGTVPLLQLGGKF